MRLTSALVLGLVALSLAQNPPPPKPPVVLLSLPMGLPVGQTTPVELRGQRLDSITEVTASLGKVKLLAKDKVAVPNGLDASRIGDTRVRLEYTAPDNTPADASAEVTFTLTAPEGKATAKVLLETAAVIAEKEPNDSFKQAQPIRLGDTVAGVIGWVQDVDVYRFTGKKGQRVQIEVIAARRGSGLDAFLSVYDDKGQLLQSIDDVDGSRDARLTLILPRDGQYHIVLSDADDTGGPTHVYRLMLAAK
ncbi:MAG: PPC domain-containing protein [Gemmataceae bacterium]